MTRTTAARENKSRENRPTEKEMKMEISTAILLQKAFHSAGMNDSEAIGLVIYQAANEAGIDLLTCDQAAMQSLSDLYAGMEAALPPAPDLFADVFGFGEARVEEAVEDTITRTAIFQAYGRGEKFTAAIKKLSWMNHFVQLEKFIAE